MAKPEWGTKRICPNCGARYYDLRKNPPVCPSCGTEFDPEALLRSRRTRSAPIEELKKVAAKPVGDTIEADLDEETETDDEGEEDIVEDVEDDLAETADEEEDVLIEDASELGEDVVDDVVDVDDEEER